MLLGKQHMYPHPSRCNDGVPARTGATPRIRARPCPKRLQTPEMPAQGEKAVETLAGEVA